MSLTPVLFCCPLPFPPLSAGADRAQATTIADTKRPMPIITEQEAVAPEAFPNPSEVRPWHSLQQCSSASLHHWCMQHPSRLHWR
jgi:hypothetical protein